jgi:NADPH:quinone reductase-like Zn-dependent oxidoreductase
VLKSDGRMVTIAAATENSRDDREKKAFFIMEPNRAQLLEIGGLLENKALRTVVDAVLPFRDASAAYAGKLPGRQGRGKIVVTVRTQRGTAATS